MYNMKGRPHFGTIIIIRPLHSKIVDSRVAYSTETTLLSPKSIFNCDIKGQMK